MNVISPETRMMGLPYGEEIMIVGRTMWTQSTSVTDRQTDRRTDGRTDRIRITKTVLRIASHGNNGTLNVCYFCFKYEAILMLCQSIERRWLRVAVQRSGGTFADVDVNVDVTFNSSSSNRKDDFFAVDVLGLSDICQRSL